MAPHLENIPRRINPYWVSTVTLITIRSRCLTMSTPASTEAVQTYARNASQTKNLMSPGSLSFPTDHNKLTPHSNAGLKAPEKGASAGSPLVKGNDMAPVTPAATPDAQQTGSGLTPTLQ